MLRRGVAGYPTILADHLTTRFYAQFLLVRVAGDLQMLAHVRDGKRIHARVDSNVIGFLQLRISW
jgi:hypothetical protein